MGTGGTQIGEVFAMEVGLFVVGIAAGLVGVAAARGTAEQGPDTVVELLANDLADPDAVPEWAVKHNP